MKECTDCTEAINSNWHRMTNEGFRKQITKERVVVQTAVDLASVSY